MLSTDSVLNPLPPAFSVINDSQVGPSPDHRQNLPRSSITFFKAKIFTIKAPNTNPNIKNCHHHRLPLQIYCESCQEPICRNCSLLGPHNNQVLLDFLTICYICI